MTDWAAALAPHGLRPLHVVGQGMEGVVLRVEGDLVVKVWHHRPVEELEVLQAFYDSVALPVRTTRVLDVLRVGERWVSVEPHLAGEPLTAQAADPDGEAMADVLDALAEIPVHPALTSLPVLPGPGPRRPDRRQRAGRRAPPPRPRCSTSGSSPLSATRPSTRP